MTATPDTPPPADDRDYDYLVWAPTDGDAAPPAARCCDSHHAEGCTDGTPGCCPACPINPAPPPKWADLFGIDPTFDAEPPPEVQEVASREPAPLFSPEAVRDAVRHAVVVLRMKRSGTAGTSAGARSAGGGAVPRSPRPKPAKWPGVCANCGGRFPIGALIVPLFEGYRSLACCPEESP